MPSLFESMEALTGDYPTTVRTLTMAAAELAGDGMRSFFGDRRRFLTVFHGDDDCRADVLVLDKAYGREPIFLMRRSRPISSRSVARVRRNILLPHMTAEEAAELVEICAPEIVAAKAPKMINLSVPWPSWTIQCGSEMSTSGALVRDRDGVLGVTASFHGTGRVGTKVMLGAHQSKVKRADPVTDTVFIPLPEGINIPERMCRGGLMSGQLPRERERHTFYGATSGMTETHYTGRDQGLPNVRRGRQLCVQTLPNIESGDSGAALISQDDKLVGFAFQRTAFGETPEFADWIWAESALTALNLKLETANELV